MSKRLDFARTESYYVHAIWQVPDVNTSQYDSQELAMLIREKVLQAIDILKEVDVDCWVTFVRESQLNGDPVLDLLLPANVTWHTALVLTSSGDAIAIAGKYDKQMIDDTGAYKEVIGYVQGIREPFQNVMRRINPRTIAVNYSMDSEICDGLTHGMFLVLTGLLREIDLSDRLVSAEPIVSALRQRKTQTELRNIREAILATESIFGEVASIIKVGKTEKEIAAFMRSKVELMKIDYAWDPGSCPAVFTGPDTAEAHYGPTDRKVEEGHVLNMDFGVKVNGYCSDLQRTFYILGKSESTAPADVKRGFETIVQSIEGARLAMRPGVHGIDVDGVARRILQENGYAEFPHALGHQVGRFSHDGTALLGPAWEKYARKPFIPLEEGMVFTLEPRLTIAGRGIATVEEMVIVTADGAEYLSTPQKDLLLIPS